jgi:hypothetical protein
MTAVLFGLSGIAAGVTEAWFLARRARRGPHPLSFLLRLSIVAAVLVLAAHAGHLLSGALGWIGGFLVTAIVAYRRLR